MLVIRHAWPEANDDLLIKGNAHKAPCHDDVIKGKHFPRHWPFVPGFHRSTVKFPSQKPVTRSFNVFFDLRPNKRLSKQSWCWWFETPSCPLWRHCNMMQWQHRWHWRWQILRFIHINKVQSQHEWQMVLQWHHINATVPQITANSTICSTACSCPQHIKHCNSALLTIVAIVLYSDTKQTLTRWTPIVNNIKEIPTQKDK